MSGAIERSVPMRAIIPEIDSIVKFYTAEMVGEMARETGLVQRKSNRRKFVGG
jgi:hypothetical protein